MADSRVRWLVSVSSFVLVFGDFFFLSFNKVREGGWFYESVIVRGRRSERTEERLGIKIRKIRD